MDRLTHVLKNFRAHNLYDYLKNMHVLVLAVIALRALTVARQLPDPITNGKELKLVHVVMRHGARSPVTMYPNDPFKDEKFEPNGLGQLTNNGIANLHDFGECLRNRYKNFLGERYSSLEYYCQATGVDRSIASMMAVNSGLWKPIDSQKWNKNLHWFPVPVLSEPLDEDMLLLVRKDCPQYNIELEKVRQSPEIKEKLQEFKELFQYVEKATGQDMNHFDDIEDVYTTLLAEQSYGLTLPIWTKGYFPEKMEVPSSWSFVVKSYNEKMRRLKGGLLLKKLLNDWKAKVDGSIEPAERKMFLYGGHDGTIANLLSTLNIFDPQVPGYGMAVVTELLYDTQQEQYGVELFVRNSTDCEFIQMQLPGCEKFCPIDKVIKLTTSVIPNDWNKECETDDPNYVIPKQSGP